MFKKIAIIMIFCLAGLEPLLSMDAFGKEDSIVRVKLSGIANLTANPKGYLEEFIRLQKEEEQHKKQYAWSSNQSILSWLPEKNYPYFPQIKRFCLEEDPICRSDLSRGKNIVQAVENNPDDKNFYGRTYFALVDARLPFFQKTSSYFAPINVLVLADGLGRVGCLIAYALQHPDSRVYINELSKPMAEKVDKLKGTLPKEIQKKIQIVNCDCLGLITSYTKLKGIFRLIYTQHLEHFLNPDQHKNFFNMINDALSIGGEAFFVSETFTSESWQSKRKDYFLYQRQLGAGKLYPGFLSVKAKLKTGEGASAGQGVYEVQDAWAPKVGALCYLTIQKNNIIEAIKNHFTPEVYQRVMGMTSSLKLIDTYYLNTNGERATYETDPRITSVLARVVKMPTLTMEQVRNYWHLKEILLFFDLQDKKLILLPLVGLRLLD